MTAAPPPRDSALDALGFAFGVLRKPGYLWAPMALTVVLLLPLLAVSAFGPPPPVMPSPGFTPAQPVFATQAEFEAYFASFMPALAAWFVLLLVLGPLSSAVIYRLALRFVEGEPPRPFAPGIVNLAWRFFLQGLALLLLLLLACVALVLIVAVTDALIGAGAALLVAVILAFTLLAVVGLRLGLAPIMMLWSAGPIEGIDRSWNLTRGHLGRVFRWFVVVGVLVALLSAAISGLITALSSAAGLPFVGQLAGAVVVAPLGVMQAIGLVQLARLLQNPIPPPPPPPALPDWMQTSAPQDPPGGPPVASA
jgi:hypothetical protein